MDLYKKHEGLLKKAINALHTRSFFAAFPEHPAPSVYGETADADGQAKFKATIGTRFQELLQDSPKAWKGQEESPYLQEPLNILYPVFDPDELVARSKNSFHTWRKLDYEERAGILLESLDHIRTRFF